MAAMNDRSFLPINPPPNRIPLCEISFTRPATRRITYQTREIVVLKYNTHVQTIRTQYMLNNEPLRRRTLVFSEVPEAPAGSKPAVKRDHDTRLAHEIVQELGIGDFYITYVHRIPRQNEDKRIPLLKVSFGTPHMQTKVLFSVRKLRNSQRFRNVHIYPDMSWETRQVAYRMRQIRNALRRMNVDAVIYANQLCRRSVGDSKPVPFSNAELQALLVEYQNAQPALLENN